MSVANVLAWLWVIGVVAGWLIQFRPLIEGILAP